MLNACAVKGLDSFSESVSIMFYTNIWFNRETILGLGVKGIFFWGRAKKILG